MGHFAKIDENNIVTEVIVVANENLLDENGDEQESIGQTFIAETLKLEGNWQQTSYNHTIRGRFAGIGYSSDEENDHFISPQPYPSWKLVEDTCQWNSPIAYPDDGKKYYWDEDVYQADNSKGWILNE